MIVPYFLQSETSPTQEPDPCVEQQQWWYISPLDIWWPCQRLVYRECSFLPDGIKGMAGEDIFILKRMLHVMKPSALTIHVCSLYKLQESNPLLPGSTSYTLSKVSEEKAYLFRVKSRYAERCKRSEYWSDWTTAVSWGPSDSASELLHLIGCTHTAITTPSL